MNGPVDTGVNTLASTMQKAGVPADYSKDVAIALVFLFGFGFGYLVASRKD